MIIKVNLLLGGIPLIGTLEIPGLADDQLFKFSKKEDPEPVPEQDRLNDQGLKLATEKQKWAIITYPNYSQELKEKARDDTLTRDEALFAIGSYKDAQKQEPIKPDFQFGQMPWEQKKRGRPRK